MPKPSHAEIVTDRYALRQYEDGSLRLHAHTGLTLTFPTWNDRAPWFKKLRLLKELFEDQGDRERAFDILADRALEEQSHNWQHSRAFIANVPPLVPTLP